jgi:hypothetical protein
MTTTLAELEQHDQAAAFQREVIAAARKGDTTISSRRSSRISALYERQPSRRPLRADDPLETFEADR